jgi:hypothetical protein
MSGTVTSNIRDSISAHCWKSTGPTTSGSGTSVARRYLDAMAGLWCVNVGYGRFLPFDELQGPLPA